MTDLPTLAGRLTKERLRAIMTYEPETGLFWWIAKDRQAGSADGLGYIRIQIDGKLYKAHRLAWLYIYSVWPSLDIDHVNGVPEDNRIANLRLADRAQQSQNGTGSRKDRQLPRGVSWSTQEKKYRAQIRNRGKSISLGSFADIDEAAAAHRKASLELHGEFSVFHRQHLMEGRA